MDETPVKLTLAGSNQLERFIKKSRFMAHVTPAHSVKAAMIWLDTARDAKASHNAWAYKIGNHYRFSDDGEPGGTAGRPILRAIEQQGLDGVMALVTRYFGGIKLGTGGLARAYGGVVAECLRTTKKRIVTPIARMTLRVPFELIGRVYTVFETFQILAEPAFGAGGGTFVFLLPLHQRVVFAEAIQDATQGRAALESMPLE